MKIHIVQKGDTLWKLAQTYGVDFEELKQLNAQLANPNMIMPGMKIKIPSETKQVQKQSKNDKTIQPYKDISPKAMPMMKEDDKKPAAKVKKTMPKPAPPQEMPMQPIQMPSLPNFYSTNYHIDVDVEDNDVEINQQSHHHQQQPPKPIQQPMPMHQPMLPICYMIPPCMPVQWPKPISAPMQQGLNNKCHQPIDPCETYQSPQQWMQHPTMPAFHQTESELESSSVEMPPPPNQQFSSHQQAMPPGYWPMSQEAMWAPTSHPTMPPQPTMGMHHQSQSMQSPMMQPPSFYEMQPGMQSMQPMQPMQPGMQPMQPGMQMPFQPNFDPISQQGAYPIRNKSEDNE